MRIQGLHGLKPRVQSTRSCTATVTVIALSPSNYSVFQQKRKMPRGEEWTKAVQRADQISKSKVWKPTQNSRICSIHFVDCKPTIPTINLGEAGKFYIPIKERKPRKTCAPTSHKKCQNVCKDHLDTTSMCQPEPLQLALHPTPSNSAPLWVIK